VGDHKRVEHYIKRIEHPSKRSRYKRAPLARTNLGNESEWVSHEMGEQKGQ
jgi:hypothetical protein